jgi:hypothetical protein
MPRLLFKTMWGDSLMKRRRRTPSMRNAQSACNAIRPWVQRTLVDGGGDPSRGFMNGDRAGNRSVVITDDRR